MERQGLQCVIAGGESLVIHCAHALQQDGHVVAALVTASRSVEAWARQHGIDVVAPGQDLAARLPRSFDWFFSITNLSVIPPEVLARAREGAVNFHDGPLPRYAGLYATAWALMNRESSHGITWHLMTDAVDEGDILEQRLFELRPDETSFTLNTRCYEAAIESFGGLIARIASGTVERRAQPAGERHYFGRTRRPAAAATLSLARARRHAGGAGAGPRLRPRREPAGAGEAPGRRRRAGHGDPGRGRRRRGRRRRPPGARPGG